MLCFYICLIIFSIGPVAAVLSTRVPGFFFDCFKNYKSLIMLLVIPFIAMIPDFTIKYLEKIYYLKQADIIKRMENIKPDAINISDSRV